MFFLNTQKSKPIKLNRSEAKESLYGQKASHHDLSPRGYSVISNNICSKLYQIINKYKSLKS